MPACFQLSLKSSSTFEAVTLNSVDEDICAHYGSQVHPKRWFCDWYNTIGFSLACGHDWDYIRADFRERATKADGDTSEDRVAWYMMTIAICDYLESKYTSNSFHSHR